MSSDGTTTRRRIARVVLCVGALFQIFLIGGLPLGQMNSTEMQSFASLAALFAVSVGCAVGLRRRGRESVATLTVGSIFAMYLMLRVALAIRQHLSSAEGPFSQVQTMSLVLATCAIAPLPIALLAAWPLGSGATNLGESK
jgi:hypothetical protein